MTNFILTTHADHNPLVVALREAGVEIRRIEWRQPLPDLTGCLAFYGNLFDEIKDWLGLARLKKQLRQNKVPYVFWNRDAPWNTGMKLKNRLAMSWLNPVDIYLTHSMQNHEWFGGEAHYFPNAAQPNYYLDTNLESLRDESRYQYDVAFFGSFGNSKDRNARERYKFLAALEDRLKQLMPKIRFKAIDTSRQPLLLAEQLTFIRTSKININIGAMCDLPKKPSWGLPERVFGIPAAGGFLLTDCRKTLTETFIDSPESFGNLDQCVRHISEALPDFAKLRHKAESMHSEIMIRHTYRHRAEHFLSLLGAFQKYRSV